MSSYETWWCSLRTSRVRKYIYLRASPAKHVSYPNHLPASRGGGTHSVLARIRRQEPQVFNVYICPVARYCPAQAKLCVRREGYIYIKHLRRNVPLRSALPELFLSPPPLPPKENPINKCVIRRQKLG